MTGRAAPKRRATPRSTAGMERLLLERDEEPLAELVAREIVDMDIRGPFLDIGAGTGIWVSMVERAGEMACGIDMLPSVLHAGRERYGLRTLILGDGARLPFRDGAFRWVQLREVIEHVDADRGATLLLEVRRVLAPGGTLRLTTPNRLKYAAPARQVARGAAGLAGRSDDPAHVHEYWPWELRRAVRAAGFQIDVLRFRAPNRYLPLRWLGAGIDLQARRTA